MKKNKCPICGAAKHSKKGKNYICGDCKSVYTVDGAVLKNNSVAPLMREKNV